MAGTAQNASGIALDELAQRRIVPPSVRADGSVRKERKVKPGYTPIEDVPLFRSRRVENKKVQSNAPTGNVVRAALGLEPSCSSSPSSPSPDFPPSSESCERPPPAPASASASASASALRSRADNVPKWEHDNFHERAGSSSSRYAPSPSSSPAKSSLSDVSRSPQKTKSPQMHRPAAGKPALTSDSSPEKTAQPKVYRPPAMRPGSATSKYAPLARQDEPHPPSPLKSAVKESARPGGASPSTKPHRRGRGRAKHGKQASVSSASLSARPAPRSDTRDTQNAAASPAPALASSASSPSGTSTHSPLAHHSWLPPPGTRDWADFDDDDLFSPPGPTLAGVSGSVHATQSSPAPAATDSARDGGASPALETEALTETLDKLHVAS